MNFIIIKIEKWNRKNKSIFFINNINIIYYEINKMKKPSLEKGINHFKYICIYNIFIFIKII